MQSEDNDDGGLAPGKEADDAMRKLFRFLLRQYRIILDMVLRSQIFRQIVQKRRRQAGACQGFFVLYDGKDASKTVSKIFIVNYAVLP